MIRAIFFGSPEFALPSLQHLIDDEGIEIAAVITQPDRPAGRGRHLKSCPVKQAAEEAGLLVIQPSQPGDPEFRSLLAMLKPDVGVLVAYGEFLPGKVLSIPLNGCLNLHPSLLPRYRGASPIQSAILNGDNETGISIIKMSGRLDAGPVLAQTVVHLDGSETAGELHNELALSGARLLVDTIHRWVSKSISPVKQDESLATYCAELSKDSGRVNWNAQAEEIERQVRAMTPWPRAWTTFRGDRFIIHAVEHARDMRLPPGQISRHDKTVIAGTGSTALALTKVQAAGRKVIDGLTWYRGQATADKQSLEFDMVESSS